MHIFAIKSIRKILVKMESVKQRQVGELIKRHLNITLQQEGTYIYGATPLVSLWMKCIG